MNNKPECWVLIKIKDKDSKEIYQIFAGWYGGFASGDSWKLSSNIKSVVDEENYYSFKTASGNTYSCYKNRMGLDNMSFYHKNLLFEYQESVKEAGEVFEIVDDIPSVILTQ